MSCDDDFGFLDLDELFPNPPVENSLSYHPHYETGSSDDGNSIFSSPSYSPAQSQDTTYSPTRNNTSPKMPTLDSLLSSNDSYTDQFVETIIDQVKQIPKPTYRPSDHNIRSTTTTSNRPSPYPIIPSKRVSIEEIPAQSTFPLEKRLRKTPVKEQKIHATDKCQIVKIEPETCESLSLETQEMLGVTGNGVFVKVEPQISLNQPKTFKHSVKAPDIVVGNRDLLSQACHAIGMNSRGQIYKRTEAQIRAEERKIRNRQSASISRERKKRHLEETELRNKDLVMENTRLRKKTKDLEDQIRILQNALERGNGIKSVGTKRMLVTSTALFSLAFIGFLTYPQIPLSNNSVITEVSFPQFSSRADGISRRPTGRKLMSVNEMSSIGSSDDFWIVDDVLRDLRNNNAFTYILKLVQNGPIEIRRMVQRKIYEEFKISFRELRRSYPLKFQRSIGIESDWSRATARPQRAPKLENQMCEPKVNGKEIHRMFDSWRSKIPDDQVAKQTVKNDTVSNNETALIHGSRNTLWTQADLLNSLGPSLKNNSYYVVSHAHLPIIAPMKQDNTSNPKITFVLPSEKTNFSQDSLEMYMIECIVLKTQTIKINRHGYNQLVEQEDEDTRIEIEV